MPGSITSGPLTSRVVRQMAGELSVSSSARDRTERLVAVLRESLGVHAAVVYERRRAGGSAPMVYSCGISDELARHMTDRRLDPERVSALEAFIDDVTVARAIRSTDLAGTVYESIDQLRWAASFPVPSGEDVVGVLILAWRGPVELSDEQIDLCETGAALIGVALRQDALLEREAELATLRERARLARDIHDSATQAITAAVINIEAADRALATDPGGARRGLDAAKQLARDTLAELRRSIWNLRSSLLQERSLADALEVIAQPLRSAGLRCVIDVHGATGEVPADTAEAAVSIAREAASNIVRHAGAANAEIALVVTLSSVVLTVVDDGRGLPGTVSEASFGLVGMEERAHSVGGTLRVSSYPGRGTRVEAYLPYGDSTD